MGDRHKLDGWEIYPENLNYVQACDIHGYNYASYCQQLSDDSERLFVAPNDEISVKVVEFGKPDKAVVDIVLQSSSALETYLEATPDERVTRLILIPQQSSWGHLVIDEHSARKLLTCFDVFPLFIDIIRGFGEKIGYEDESCGGFHVRNDRKAEIFETAYLVKQVERHGREEGDPWSIRQMGIYHRNDISSGDVFIIINPTRSLQQRLKHSRKFDRKASTKALHTMILSCAMENWRFYITDLEKRYLNMKNKAQLTRMDEKGERDISLTDVRFEDIQEIQVIQDKSQQLFHVFNMNRTILQDMKQRLNTIPSIEMANDVANLEFIHSLILEADVQMSRVDSMLKRLDGTIALIRTTLDFRCLASLQHNSRLMTEMTRLAQVENCMMVRLTSKASRDTDVLKTITLLTLIYLPASFVSSMMGMGYINVNAVKKFSIQIKGEFWVFFVLTAVLLICTLSPYFWYIRRKRVIERHQEYNSM